MEHLWGKNNPGVFPINTSHVIHCCLPLISSNKNNFKKFSIAKSAFVFRDRRPRGLNYIDLICQTEGSCHKITTNECYLFYSLQ